MFVSHVFSGPHNVTIILMKVDRKVKKVKQNWFVLFTYFFVSLMLIPHSFKIFAVWEMNHLYVTTVHPGTSLSGFV